MFISEEVFELMSFFEASYINCKCELILSEKGNVYFPLKNKEEKTDIIRSILEWCSRDVAKGMPFCSDWRNNKWRNDLRERFNRYLGVDFSDEEWNEIYCNIGNGINRRKADLFISNGFDFKYLK